MAALYKKMGLRSNVVYLRALDHSQLPDEVRADLDETQVIYGVFHEDGDQIALIDDLNLARDLADEHKFSLHTVH